MKAAPEEHVHRIERARLVLGLSGYVDRPGYGYVYGYTETCRCGATRTVQYRSAAAAEDAHAHLPAGAVT